MKKKLASWRLIRDSLVQHRPVMLLYVLESSGSSPGRQGFFMAVDANGGMEGSIGGGMMEQKLVELAKEILREKAPQPLLKKQVHRKDAARDQSGMICSGEQTVWLYPVKATDLRTIEKILSCLQDHQSGGLRLSPSGLDYAEEAYTATKFQFNSAENWAYQEPLGFQNHLYLVGGGHCALALSRLMSTMDFYIHLFENREDLFTVTQNEAVHTKTVVDDYAALRNLIPSGERNYVVVMTFGYRTDDAAVRALLDKWFRYFGLLGSKAKIEKMLADLRADGFTDSLLRRLHAPVGLPINSKTPEEIAVSIAAEIIQVKNAASVDDPSKI